MLSITELGAGPRRSETRHSCTGISATCCKTCWPEQWLRYLAAVVSICEYMVSELAMSLSRVWAIVRAMPPHFILCGGNCPSLLPPVPPPMALFLLIPRPCCGMSHGVSLYGVSWCLINVSQYLIVSQNVLHCLKMSS